MRLSIANATPALQRNVWPAIGTAVFIGILLLLRFDQLLDRTDPIQFIGGEVIPPVVKAGDKIQLVRRGTAYRICGGTTYRNIIDPAGYKHTIDEQKTLSSLVVPDLTAVENFVGKEFTLPVRFTFKKESPDRGVAVIKSHIVYDDCPWLGMSNPLIRVWTITVRLPDLHFTVER